jgi:hypothetical protein
MNSTTSCPIVRSSEPNERRSPEIRAKVGIGGAEVTGDRAKVGVEGAETEKGWAFLSDGSLEAVRSAGERMLQVHR